MIGAALRATRIAIPAAAAAPTSRYQGSSGRPPAARAGSRTVGRAGLTASRGRAADSGGRTSSGRPPARGSERGIGATARGGSEPASAVLRDACTRRGCAARRTPARPTSTRRTPTRRTPARRTPARARPCAVRMGAGRTRRTGTGEELDSCRGAVAARGAIACCGTTSATGAGATAAAGMAAGTGTAAAAGSSPAGTVGTAAGSGDVTGAGWGAVGAGRTGSSPTGSRYPLGSAATRTPRWTCGAFVTASSLGPTWPTTAPSATELPRATATEPSCSSVTA
jgi:hypothetical protein